MKQHNQTDRQLCIDYGSGSGIVVPSLLQQCGIEKVVGTDISARQLERGKDKFQAVFGKERYETIVGAAGELHSIADASVDVVTAAEAVHWFDTQKWLKEVARILKPSGTLAFWHYPGQPYITQHPEATPFTAKIFRRLFAICFADGCISREQTMASTSLLDSVDVDPTYFKHQVRRKWMLPEDVQEQLDTGIYPELMLMDEDYDAVLQAEAKVLEAQHVVVYKMSPRSGDEPFLRERNWTTTTMMQYMTTLLGKSVEKAFSDEQFQNHLKAIENIVGGPQANFDVAWQFALFVGTRV